MPRVSTERDHVDRVREMWKKESPEWDTSPISIIARLGRAATFVDVQVEAILSAELSDPTRWVMRPDGSYAQGANATTAQGMQERFVSSL